MKTYLCIRKSAQTVLLLCLLLPLLIWDTALANRTSGNSASKTESDAGMHYKGIFYSNYFLATHLRFSTRNTSSELGIPAAPTITCPTNVTTNTSPGLCRASVSGLNASTNDPDNDIVTLTWSMSGATNASSAPTGINNIPSPYDFNEGITTVTYTVTDALGSSASCSFTVTVNDNEPPVVTCPANIHRTYSEGSCNATITPGLATATDNCGVAGSVTGTRSDGLALNAAYPTGVTTITWTATDINGNTGTCNQTITITQGVLLVNYNYLGATSYPITPNQSATGISCQCTSSEPFNILGTEGTLSGNLAFVDNTVANPAIYMEPSNFTNTRYFQFHLSGDSLYKYRKFRIYVQAKRGNRAAQTINFAYSTDPVSYTVNGSMSLISSGIWYEKTVDWSGVSLINNRSDLYIRLFASNGTGGIGDERLFIDNFQVVAVDGPLAQPNDVTIPENTIVNIPVLNNDFYGCNGPSSSNSISVVSFPGQGNVISNPDHTFTYIPNPNVNGSDSFIYQICDASGSCDTSIVNITILPVSYAPTVNCPGDILSGSDVGLCAAVVNDLIATYSDQDGNVTTLTWTMTGATVDASPLTGINNLPSHLMNFGISTITYAIADADGLTDTCSYTVEVYDSENPSITCPGDTIFLVSACDSLTDPVILNPPAVSDNCGILNLTSNAPSQFPVGTTSVIWMVTDIHGNSSPCEQFVIVNQEPSMVLTMSSTANDCYSGNDGTATVNVSGGTSPYTFAWNTVPVQSTQTAINLAAGTYTVTVTDADGCTESASVDVTQPADSIVITITNQQNVQCFGGATGSFTVSSGGGTPAYQYSIDGINFQSSGTFNNLTAGIYTVTVLDALNCTNTLSVSITEPAIALAATIQNQTSVNCLGSSTGSATIQASGGTAPYQYSINGGPYQPTGTFTNLAAGLYVVSVLDANNCTALVAVTITEPLQALTAVISAQTNVKCNGQANGTATVTASGGIPPYSYTWNTTPQQTGTTAVNLAVGSYTVTVTDSVGCTVTATAIITQPAPLTVSITPVNVACFGGNTGSATAIVTGGTQPYTYAWLTVPIQTTPTANNLTAGSYTVAVFDSNNCFRAASVVITQPASALTAAITNQVNVICAGSNTGEFTVAASGGTAPYSYSANGGTPQVSGTFTNLPGGVYNVLVTDANGCVFNIVVTITEPANPLQALIISQQNVSCNGQANGSATVNVTGGVQPYTYSWSTVPAQTGTSISGLTAGSYTVTVTDSLGCTTTATAIITQPEPLVVTITPVNVTCFGGNNGSATAIVTGGTQPYTYAWLTVPIQTTPTASNLTAGSYTVAVFDSNNCFRAASVVITQPASALTAAITNQVNVICAGSNTGEFTVAASGGTAPYSYSANGGTPQVSGTFTNLPGGVYNVLVTDANGCTFNVVVTITEPANPLQALIINQQNVSCNGQANGSATVSVTGGVQPYSYSWSTVPVQTGTSISGLTAGSYTVTVTDSAGCTATATAIITQPEPLAVTITPVSVACFGGNTGSATATVTGGTQPYTYAWLTVPIQTTPTANNLSAGSYTVAVFDSNNCFRAASVVITQPAAALSAVISNQSNVICAGTSSGQFTVTGTGGTAPYLYSVNGGTPQVSGTFTNLPGGVYNVLVTDAEGCTYSTTLNISEPTNPLAATISSTNVSCFGQANGSATVTATGGATPYTYLWNTTPPQTGTSVSGLAPGTYTVTVTDSAGCDVMVSVTITQPDLLTVTILPTNVACFGGNTGSATAVVTGGTPPYSYAWLTVPIQNTATATNLLPGTYTVAVFDSNNCFRAASVVITQPATALIATVTNITPVTCLGNATGSVTVQASGGVPAYAYSIDGGIGQASGTFNSLTAGPHIVTVTDAAGCSIDIPVQIPGPVSGITANVTDITNVLCYGEATGSALVTASNGIPPYQYSLNGGPSQPVGQFNNLIAGNYIVTISDGSICTLDVPFTITQPADSLIATITASTNVSCFGGTNGSATVTASGGTAPYTYLWNTIPAQTDSVATSLTAGVYTVTVTDGAGCQATATVTISESLSTLAGTITAQTNVLCLGNATGSVTVEGAGGSTPYQYSLNGGPLQVSGTFTNLTAGTYTVTITDAAGCSTDVSVVITEPATGITATFDNLENVLCYGQATGTVSLTATSGVAPFQYSLNGGTSQPTGTFSGLFAGSYFITVSDGSSCTRDFPFIIAQPSDTLLLTITSQVNVACLGANTGSATALATGGTAPYLYSWSTIPAQSGATASNLTAGIYTVTVTDAANCQATALVVITESLTSLTATVTSQTNVLCLGNATGEVTVTAAGGTPAYQYSLDGGPAQASGTFTNLLAGTYTITVTDAAGCQIDVPVVITEPATGITASFDNIQPVLCYGEATGSVTLTALTGIPPFAYSLNGNTPQLSGTFNGLFAGSYVITVIDGSSCTRDFPFIITQPADTLIANIISQTNISCFGLSDGSVTVAASGGTAPYSFSWNTVPVQTGTTISSLSAGSYIVTVTDDNGCQATAQVIITQPALPLLLSTASTTDEDCAGNANGSATMLAAGGTAPYQYSINAGPYQNSNLFSGLSAGVYSVSVLDANGCTASSSFTISVSGELIAVDDYYTTNRNVALTDNVLTNDLGFCNPPVSVTSNTLPLNGIVTVNADGSFTYTPNLDYTGSDSFTYTITDLAGNDSTAVVYITIDGNNTPPVTFNEYLFVQMNLTETGNVLANGDFDPDGTNLSVSLIPVVDAINGTFNIAADGTFSYTPNLNYIGTDMVVVSVCDEGTPLPSACTNDTLFILVLPPNLPPVIFNEALNICQDASFFGTVTNGGTVFNGDFDPENNLPLTVSSVPVLGPTNGTFSITDTLAGTFNYTPAAGYTGTDMVVVSICDAGTPIECSNDTIFITVLTGLVANAGPGQLLCNADATFLIGNSPGTGSSSWAFVSGPNIPSIFPSTGSVAVVSGLVPSAIPYIFSYSIDNGSCIAEDTMMVMNYIPPTHAYAGIDQEYCSQTGVVSTFLAANTPVYGTGKWTQLSGPLAVIVNDTSPNSEVTGLTYGIYAFQWAISNGICQADADVVHITITQPAQVFAGGNASICEGNTYQLITATASNYTTLLWSSSGTGIFDDPTLLNPVYIPSATDILNGSVALTLTAEAISPCPAVSNQMVLTISRSAIADAGPDATVCQDAGFTISEATAENSSVYYWATTGLGTLTDSTTLTPTYIPASGESGQILLILNALSAAPCLAVADTMILSIGTPAIISAGADTSMCGGGSFLVSGSSASAFTTLGWETSGTGVFDDAGLINPTYTPSPNDINDGFVYLTLRARGSLLCPEAIDVMRLEIHKQATAYAGQDIFSCGNSDVTINGASAQNYDTITWTTTGTGILIGANTITPTYTPVPGETGNLLFILVASGEGICSSATDTMQLTLYPATVAFAGNDIATCGSNPVTLSQATASNYSSLLWSSSGNGTFSDSSILNPVYTPGSFDVANGVVMLTLRATSTTACGDITDQLVLTISPTPKADAGPDITSCSGNSYIIINQATASAYSSLAWSLTPASAGSLLNASTLNPEFIPAPAFIGTATLSLEILGTGSCGSVVVTDEMNVTISNVLSVDAGPDQTISTGSTTILSGNAVGGSGLYAWNWQPASLVVNANNASTATLNLNSATTFNLTVLDILSGCSSTDSVLIKTGIDENSIRAIPDYDTTLTNKAVTIDVLDNDINPEGDPLIVSLCGFPSNGLVVLNSDRTITYTPYADYVGEDMFCYRICNAAKPWMCSDTMVFIYVKQPSLDDLFVYNGVSPNGDGNNDVWTIRGIENYPDNTVLIFNRWGDKIREYAKYNNTTRSWDGKNEKGELLPNGTYFYILDIKDVGVLKGWIYVRGNE